MIELILPNDKFGVKMIYPNRAGQENKNWFIHDNFEDDPRIRMDENVSGNNTDGYRLDDNGMVRLAVFAENERETTCKNDFPTSFKRGWVSRDTDWKMVEMTGFYKLTKAEPRDNEIIMKGPTGEHHSNTDCCSGSSYQVRIGLENPVNTEFAKEMWHVNYSGKNLKNISGENYTVLGHGWFGVKYMMYPITVSGKKSVKLECWYNKNGDKQTWKKVNEYIDGGGWGSKGDKCNGANDQILAFGNARMMWRWDHRDGNDLRFKWLSIREIDPQKQFDETPSDPVNPPTTNPTTTIIHSTLKLYRNVNCDEGPGCGALADTNIYEIEVGTGTQLQRLLVNHTDQSFRDKCMQKVHNSGSSLNKKIPKIFMAEVKKIGTPSGNISGVIIDRFGVTRTTVNISANTLPTSFGSLTTFSMGSNTYSLQVGDRIGVQYLGTDPDNCVAVNIKNPGDGSTATQNSTYNDSTNVWTDFPTRDMYCQVWA